LEKVLAAMQVPFPELTVMQLISNDKTPPVVRDTSLGGSALRLRYFGLSGIPFPGSGLPNLLLSLSSVLSSLESLSLQFQSPQSHLGLESRSLPPLKPIILPALEEFRFKGVTE
jgi:hypothetical protein